MLVDEEVGHLRLAMIWDVPYCAYSCETVCISFSAHRHIVTLSRYTTIQLHVLHGTTILHYFTTQLYFLLLCSLVCCAVYCPFHRDGVLFSLFFVGNAEFFGAGSGCAAHGQFSSGRRPSVVV
jgi:hypothetical protein